MLDNSKDIKLTQKLLPSRECGFTVRTAVLAVAGVQFDVPVARSLVLEQTRTELAPKRHLV